MSINITGPGIGYCILENAKIAELENQYVKQMEFAQQCGPDFINNKMSKAQLHNAFQASYQTLSTIENTTRIFAKNIKVNVLGKEETDRLNKKDLQLLAQTLYSGNKKTQETFITRVLSFPEF